MPPDGELGPTTEPRIIIHPSLAAEDAEVLAKLDAVIADSPDFAEQSLDLYMSNPELTGSIVELITKHPEGLAVFGIWQHVFERRLDIENDIFDPATGEAIQDDSYHKSLVKDFRATEDETFRTKMRHRGLKILIERNKAA